MSYEVTHAHGDQENRELRAGLATNDRSPFQWGQYCERLDGDDWTPLVYEADSFEDALDMHLMTQRLSSEVFRRSRVVRRAVSPWEVWTR